MADVNSILNRLVSSLTVSDPTWDVSVGSAAYKILESVANEIANTANNATLQTYSFDVTSKTGTELDAFVNLFGMSRQLGKRSYGYVTFTIPNVLTTNINIPTGTQVYAAGTNTTTGASVFFSTVAPALISAGQTTVQVPAVATLIGTAGNVSAGAISYVQTSLVGNPIVSNPAPFTGGTDTETDTQLQVRWLQTGFGNISGIADKFIAVAQQNPNVLNTNVVGAQQLYLEQIPVVTTIVGSGNFNLGLQSQSLLTVSSGSNLASLQSGSFPSFVTVTGTIIANPSSLLPPASGISLYYNGSNYTISTTYSGGSWSPPASGTYNVTYTLASGGFSGTSTIAAVTSGINGLFNTSNVTAPSITSSGLYGATSPVTGSGIQFQFNQPTSFNLIASGTSAGATVSGINSIISTIPDSKYAYPQGSELVGLNIGSYAQTIYTNNSDYIYPVQTSGLPLPLQISLIPNANNAPNTYTGSLLQLQSEYIPKSSRITNPTTNSNYIDVFVNTPTSTLTNEQIFFNPTNVLTSGNSSAPYYTGNFAYANGTSANVSGNLNSAGDYFIPVANRPMVNFPAQLVSGNAPSYVILGNYNIPIALQFVNYAIQATGTSYSINGYTYSTTSGSYYGPIIPASGSAGSNLLYTSTSISGLSVGLVANFNQGTVTSGWIPQGAYITALQQGSPNVITLSTTLNSGVNNAIQWNTVAYPLYDTTLNAGSINDLTHIAIDSNNAAGYGYPLSPATATVGTFSHFYNSDISQVETLEQQARVVGTNVLTHQAQILRLTFNLSIVYQQNVNVPSVNNAIYTAVNQYLQNITFNSTLSLSQVVSAVLLVPGVASARITTTTDNSTNYGVQSVAIDGTVLQTYTRDILIPNNQIPSLYNVKINGYGANNF